MKNTKRPSTLAYVMEFIQKDLKSTKYKIGSKYLTERELCEKLNVSRTTVREALRMVQVMGHLELRPGKGAFVRQPSINEPVRWITLSKEDLLELTEVRTGLEPLAARLAARRGTEDDFCIILGAMALFERACKNGNIVAMAEADDRFHTAIASASHNETLMALCRTMNESLIDCRTGLFAIPGNGDAAIHEHQAIVNALSTHQEEAAFSAMAKHLENVKYNIIEIAGE